jgi:nondiscriminating aspartyl-tRNA synthetase
MQRTQIKDAFNKTTEILLKGWVHETRDLKKVRFLILKDRTGRIQITASEKNSAPELFALMDNLSRESVVQVTGTMKECKQAPNGQELIPTSLEIISEAKNPLPIDVSDYSKTELPLRLDNRFLDLHSVRTQAIFKIQSTILQTFREFMIKENALEVTLPSIISASSEGGTELFKAKYFEKEVFLSQSCQLYKQMLACSMEKIFTVFTTWRAEKHNTIRHLNEARQLDYEEAFADDKKVMEVMARCVQFIAQKIIEKRGEELETLKVELKVPEVKYMTFQETSELMKKQNISVPEHDLSGEAEKKLGELFPNTIIFVTDWPIAGKPFYIMPDGENSKGFDAIYNGIEITSGGQRIHDPKLLTERLKANNLNPEDFEPYINSFTCGAPPHAGWGLGLERLTMLMLGLDNIREAVLFPRDRDRITP